MPERDDTGGIGHFLIAKDVRMTAHHFIRDPGGHVGEGEVSGFAGNLRLKDDMEQKIAQFLVKMLRRAGINSIKDLVALLQKLRLERGRGLLDVPGTAVRRTQARHQLEQPVHRRESGDRLVHCILTSWIRCGSSVPRLNEVALWTWLAALPIRSIFPSLSLARHASSRLRTSESMATGSRLT